MPRKPNSKVEEGYLRSFWEELDEISRECAGVCTVTLYLTNQRGVFSVEMRALVLSYNRGADPITHVITKRLPDGGSLPFAGSLWFMASQLNNMATSDHEQYERSLKRPG